jgi:SAM-dependent methyltransferase
MGNECSKAVMRRINQAGYNRYFKGRGIDIGAGTDSLGNSDGLGRYLQQFPTMISCSGWDIENGDAQYMKGVADSTYDFVHSSHCLEHMVDPYVALMNWIRIVRPGGYLIITIPDEDLYEQGGKVENGKFYSTYNGDHKRTFTIMKKGSWSPVSVNVVDLLSKMQFNLKIIKLELLDQSYQYGLPRHDQTGGIAECAIEFIIQKL